MPSRLGPRKPGHSGADTCGRVLTGATGAGARQVRPGLRVGCGRCGGRGRCRHVRAGADGCDRCDRCRQVRTGAAGATGSPRRSSTGSAGAEAGGSSAACARSRSSGVGVHRQCSSEPIPADAARPGPTSRARHATTIAVTMPTYGAARRTAPAQADAPRPAPAQQRNREDEQHVAHHPVRDRLVHDERGRRTRATIITATAPSRSAHGARLKNSHHRRMRTPPPTPPRTAKMPPPGTSSGTIRTVSRISVARVTPGHKRRGLSTVRGSTCVSAISVTLALRSCARE